MLNDEVKSGFEKLGNRLRQVKGGELGVEAELHGFQGKTVDRIVSATRT